VDFHYVQQCISAIAPKGSESKYYFLSDYSEMKPLAASYTGKERQIILLGHARNVQNTQSPSILKVRNLNDDHQRGK